MIEARVTKTRAGATALLLLAGERYAAIECEADGSAGVLLADRATDAPAQAWTIVAGEFGAALERIGAFLEPTKPASDTDPHELAPESQEPNT